MVPYDQVPLYHKLYPNAYIMIVCMHLDLLCQLLTGIEGGKKILFIPRPIICLRLLFVRLVLTSLTSDCM